MSEAPRFGTAGLSDSYRVRSFDPQAMAEYTASFGLTAFEYQCGRGVRLGLDKAAALKEAFDAKGITFSVHAPYYISMSSLEEDKRLNSVNYLLQSCALVKALGGRRVIFHAGSCGKQSREAALEKALDTMRRAVQAVDEAGYGDCILCPETMGKVNQLGTLDEVLAMETGAQATVHGLVHTLRDLGDVRFALLRMPQGILQCVLGAGEDVRDGDAVTVSGEAVRDERAPGGVELHVQRVKVLSRAAEAMPVPIGKNKMNLSLDTDLSLRFVTLRNLRKRAVFKIQEGIVRGFREALQKEGFTEIHSPKIVAQNAEGGANLFRMEYFGKKAFLTQSPQFYKQMAMAAGFERIFEVGPVFRAEKSFTSKHTTEFTGFDLEFSYIESYRDVMQIEAEILTYALGVVNEKYGERIKEAFGIELIVPTLPFPVITLAELYDALAAGMPGNNGQQVYENGNFYYD